jgi:prepilin-type N-terminal cleavage/methylation domain-containing protein
LIENRRRAYTIAELLIVILVVSILAAILFPVFVQAKQAALQSSCISRFSQTAQATHIYLNDYDDVFMPVNYQPGRESDPHTDRTWVQMMLPYTGSFKTFRCPADHATIDQTIATFDPDLVPGDLSARYYTASMHVNLGYNFQYLAPVVREGQSWLAEPKEISSLPDPNSMLLFVDSTWDVVNKAPSGGGSWLVSPPCRYEEVDGRMLDTIGWGFSSDGSSQYGGAWPWHSGKLTIATVEGSVRPITLSQLGAGCNILPSWSGTIDDRHIYLWSPE